MSKRHRGGCLRVLCEAALGRLTTPQARRLGLVTLLVLAALSSLTSAYALRLSTQTQHDQREAQMENNRRINEGRAIALNVICAYGGAISEAGRTVISGGGISGSPGNDRLEGFLRELGFPPAAKRKKLARAAGAAYVQNINRRVEEHTGIIGLVIEEGPRAGSLDCDRLAAAAAVQ